MRWVRAYPKQLPRNAQVSGSTLYITDVRPEDAGDYVCQVINYGRVEKEDITTLIVRGKMKNLLITSLVALVLVNEVMW